MNTGLFYHNYRNSYNSNITNNDDGDVDMNDANPATTTSTSKPASTTTSTTTTNPPDWYDMVHQFMLHGYNATLSGKACLGTPDTTIDKHPILMIERPYNPPATRQMMTELLFEELQVPAMFLGKDAVMACYGSGRTSATVIDIGYSGTTVTPVFEGYVENKGIRRNPTSSIHHMDEMIISNLDKSYYKKKKQKNTYTVMPLYQLRQKNHKLRKLSIHTAARLHLASQCREEGAGVTINTAIDSNTMGNAADSALLKSKPTSTFNAPSKPFELPDGTVIDVPSSDRFRVADIIFGSDDVSQQYRDARLSDIKTNIQDYVSSIAATLDTNDENYKRQLAREAVGLVADGNNNNNSRSKRPRRGVTSNNNASSNANDDKTNTDSSKSNIMTTRPRKTTMAWQRACQGQIQTLLDEQLTSSSIATMVCDAAYRCDREQQAILLGNVIVCGGGSCIGPTEQAVPDNIRDNIEVLIHQHTPGWRVKVLSPSMNERAVLSWIGGSILGSLGTFHEMWITKAEYEEYGSAIVNRKCP